MLISRRCFNIVSLRSRFSLLNAGASARMRGGEKAGGGQEADRGLDVGGGEVGEF